MLARNQHAAPIEESLTLAGQYPDAVADLAIAVVAKYPKGGTFLDAALSFLPEGKWRCLVENALNILEEDNDNNAAESVIAYASLQNPKAIHPYLESVFSIRPNGSSYYSAYPWRDSGSQHFSFLKGVFENAESADQKMAAWEAMIHSRYLLAVDFARQNLRSVMPSDTGRTLEDWLNCWLHQIGLEYSEEGYTRLCNQNPYHIVFPDSFFAADSTPAWLVEQHPTWRLKSSAPTAQFGGNSNSECKRCGGTLHRLMKFESVPDEIVISGLSGLELAVCLSCLGWEEERLFFSHDGDGAPEHSFFEGEVGDPQFAVGPLKEATVTLAQTPRRWYWQDWGLSNSRENLNRIGGEPCWVQDADYPSCPSCERTMDFLMQLDSDLPTADSDEWLWGSGGMGYVFWCDTCKVSGYLWQCT
ncbi:hypothetical protein [Fuerstiella marisgermanici]|uniref:hypothetical protein n=1 Tax=Fuerstiella marisgermanici TaxID=1891926 RepID=UPI0011AB4D07|nr:hypothetical protein [Fuerstiella marisgermanici]